MTKVFRILQLIIICLTVTVPTYAEAGFKEPTQEVTSISIGTGLAPNEVTYSDFVAKVKAGEVKECNFISGTSSKIEITLTDGRKVFCGYLDWESAYDLLIDNGVTFYRTTASESTFRANLLMVLQVLSIVAPLLIFYMLFRGLSPKKIECADCSKIDTRFSDVAGQDEAIESVQEVVDYLKDPQKYQKIGARSPKGVLLVGSPGTGKTLLAKAIAGEAGVNFIQAAGSDFVEKFVGVGASRVRGLFAEARKNSPCIVFIDEVDSVGQRRNADSNSERDSTLTQILKEMDGFTPQTNIVVIAATNRPEELDPAFTRPGRFDRKIVMQLPNLKGREQILAVHLSKVRAKKGIDVHHLAVITSGLSGADLQNIVNEATFIALKNGKTEIDDSDLYSAFEVRLTGKEVQSIALSEKEREIIAYHEIGHAFTQYSLSGESTLSKISIVPRTNGALGYILHTPTEEQQHLQTAKEIQDQICVALAGKCSELLFIGTTTNGVANDLEQATDLARKYVLTYGMSQYISSGMTPSNYLGSSKYTCSKEWLYRAEQDIEALLQELNERTTQLLKENKGLLDRLAKALLEKETMTGAEFSLLVSQVQDR